MSSPLEPVNPIRLKWATSSQRTRELERRHMGFFFPLLSAPPPLITDTQWCSNPGNPRISPFQRAETQDTACWSTGSPSSFQKEKSHCCTAQCCWTVWLQPCPCASLMFPSNNPGSYQVCNGFALPSWKNGNSVWFVSNLTHRYWAVHCKCSVHPQEGGTSVFEAETLIWLLEGSIWTPKGPEIFKKLEKTFKSARTNWQR